MPKHFSHFTGTSIFAVEINYGNNEILVYHIH